MADWLLVPCLVSLRGEFNTLAPGRDKASDGAVGDQAHSTSSSDHNPDESGRTPYEDADSVNEVHAIDVDKDLRRAGWSMDRAVEIIIKRHRDGRDDRLQNVIWDRRIWSRTHGWQTRAYTGSNLHTQHAHFSARYTTAQENDTRSWGLLMADQEDDDMTPAEMLKVLTSAEGQKALQLAAGIGVHNQWLGKSGPTMGNAIQGAYQMLQGEALEVPPTAQQNAQAVIDSLATTSVHDLEGILRQGLSDDGRRALAAALARD